MTAWREGKKERKVCELWLWLGVVVVVVVVLVVVVDL